MTPEIILNIVSEYYDIPVEVIIAPCNRDEVVKPRHIAIYFCRIKTSLKTAAIAEIFSYKNHSGSVYAFKQALKQEKYNPVYKQELKDIDLLISNSEKYNEEKLYDNFQENDFYN